MTEPAQLSRGKRFHQMVQADYIDNTKGGIARDEVTIDLSMLSYFPQKRGRPDILITENVDTSFVTIIEIKATNWDRIKPKNIKRNLWSHQHQIFKYIDKYVDIEKLDVCLGIIYPYPPATLGFRELIESYLEGYGVPAYWYNEVASMPQNLGEFAPPYK